MPPMIIKPPNSGLCMLDQKNNRKVPTEAVASPTSPNAWMLRAMITLVEATVL